MKAVTARETVAATARETVAVTARETVVVTARETVAVTARETVATLYDSMSQKVLQDCSLHYHCCHRLRSNRGHLLLVRKAALTFA
jgi:hypothetical protein